MREIKKILFATDFSPISKNAMDTALLLRKSLDADLEVIHVYDPGSFEMPAPYYFMPGVETWIDEHFSNLKERGRNALQALLPELGEKTVGHFIEGQPGKKISEYANEHDIDLVVLGTHGHTGFNRLIMGSVAEYVLRHAHCGVLTIKPAEEDIAG